MSAKTKSGTVSRRTLNRRVLAAINAGRETGEAAERRRIEVNLVQLGFEPERIKAILEVMPLDTARASAMFKTVYSAKLDDCQPKFDLKGTYHSGVESPP